MIERQRWSPRDERGSRAVCASGRHPSIGDRGAVWVSACVVPRRWGTVAKRLQPRCMRGNAWDAVWSSVRGAGRPRRGRSVGAGVTHGCRLAMCRSPWGCGVGAGTAGDRRIGRYRGASRPDRRSRIGSSHARPRDDAHTHPHPAPQTAPSGADTPPVIDVHARSRHDTPARRRDTTRCRCGAEPTGARAPHTVNAACTLEQPRHASGSSVSRTCFTVYIAVSPGVSKLNCRGGVLTL